MPYKPKKQIEHLEGYDVFRQKKEAFAKRLFEKAQQLDISAKKTSYDLLVLTVPIEANSLQQSVELYSIIVKQLEGLIDKVVAELGTNDPTDEPACELLKSILQEKV